MVENIEIFHGLVAKLCHDLSDIAGTIDNCLELFEDKNPDISKQAKEIVNLESKNLVHKIQFYRSVYGIIFGEKEMSLEYLKKLANDHFNKSKVKFIFESEMNTNFLDVFMAKIVIILITVADENISRTGQIYLHIFKNDKKYKVLLNGKSNFPIKINEENIKILQSDYGKRVDVSNCREFYIKNLLNKFFRDYKISVKLRNSDEIEYFIS